MSWLFSQVKAMSAGKAYLSQVKFACGPNSTCCLMEKAKGRDNLVQHLLSGLQDGKALHLMVEYTGDCITLCNMYRLGKAADACGCFFILLLLQLAWLEVILTYLLNILSIYFFNLSVIMSS